ncbi:MAG: MFS transporter [Opitutaceae bacterium]|nr:MFS transporter [Opitutaceae bacterium]
MTTSATGPKRLFSGGKLRWFLLALLFAASFLNYVDRSTVSILKETLKGVFGMGEGDYADLVNAFTACYAAAYIASGWVVDKIGPRHALVLFAGVWSLVTVGCGFAQSFTQLLLLRALLGLAEPGLQPVNIRVATAWAPEGRRGLFMCLCGVGSSIGSIAAGFIIVRLTLAWSWHWAFILPGAVGLLICAVWWVVYRDPDKLPEPPRQAAAPPARTLTWPQLWGTRALWGIVLARLLSDPVWYFLLFWLPGYLEKQQAVDFGLLGIAGLPFLASFAGGIVMSMLSDRLARRHPRDPLNGRKNLLYAVSLLGPLCILVPHLGSLWLTMLAFCLIAVVCTAWLSTLAPILAEIFPVGNVGSVWGIAGAFGAAGAFVFNKLLGLVGAGNFPLTLPQLFLIMGFLHLAAAVLLWALVRRPSPTKI